MYNNDKLINLFLYLFESKMCIFISFIYIQKQTNFDSNEYIINMQANKIIYQYSTKMSIIIKQIN